MQIAEVFRERYRVNPRVAFRFAHGLTQEDVASAWNERWPDDPKRSVNISRWEQWPGRTGWEPSNTVLSRLAEIYHCSVVDLLADCADYRHLDDASTEPGEDMRPEYDTKNEGSVETVAIVAGSPSSVEMQLRAVSWSELLRTEREERGWSKARMARELLAAIGAADRPAESLIRQIRAWEKGEHFPRDWMDAYAKAFGVTTAELFNLADAEPAAQSPERSNGAPASNRVEQFPIEWDEMQRRFFLQLTAGIGLGVAATGAPSGEPIRQLLESNFQQSAKSVEDWALACTDHLHAIRTRNPQEAREDLIVDLFALQHQLQTADPDERIELQRIASALSALHANLLTRLGAHGPAIRWWQTAKTAAEAAGDSDLHIIVSASEAGFGLYGQRPPETVLHLARRAQQRAPQAKEVGIALAMSTEAKALTLLGRHQEAKAKIEALAHFAPIESRNDLIPTYWTEDQIDFAESWVRAGVGDESRADNARERVLAAAGDYQYVANVQLHEALCTVVSGGVDSGARRATGILDALPPSQQSAMILATAQMVARAVPISSRERPAVRELQKALTGKSAAAVRSISKGEGANG